jgi:hypothetical protein
LDCVLPGVHRHEESERLGWAIPDSYKDVDARSRQFPRPSINCPGGPECPTDPASSYHLSTPLLGLGSENSGHDIDQSLEEDKLLLGHSFSRS